MIIDPADFTMEKIHPSSDSLADEYPFEPSFIKVKKGYMHFVDKGRGRPFLMVHGNPSWSFLYRNIIREFSPFMRCIAPDHIGCGRSSKSLWHTGSLEEHINNLESLILTLDLKDITLMVHDWGGAVGFGAALRHPDRFKRFIVTNTSAFWMPRIPLRINICRIPVFGEIALQGLNLFARFAIFMAVTKKMAPKIARGFLAPYDTWANRKATLDFVRDIPLSLNHPSLNTLLNISKGLPLFREHPVQVLWGMRDFCFNKDFLDEWKKRFPLARIKEFPNAGHYLFEDALTGCIAQIREFLKEHIDPYICK